MKQLTFAFVGAGGDGSVAAGDIIASACAADGLHVIKTEAYGPQIRGGESSAVVCVSAVPIHAQSDRVDALIVFHWADFARFQNEIVLAEDAIVFCEPGDAVPADLTGRTIVEIPFTDIARESGAPASKNVFALAMLATLFHLPLDATRAAVARRFGKKKAAVAEANLKAFDRGVAEAEKVAPRIDRALEYTPSSPRLLMSGNEASAFGAIHAGCSFFAGYPITPSSEILHFLAEWLPRVGGSSLQTEDELAAIGAVVGASFAGAKAMTATSGPGLSLMAEMIGLASIAEIPSVIVNVQRGGPSTGIPTKSEQSDLLHAVFASHGDTPRVVIGCTDVEDSFHATVDAFNIAEEFQVPVIVLSDQSIAQSRTTIDAGSLVHETRERSIATPDHLVDYRRYRDTTDGISPMAIPGTPAGMYQTNGLEHDEQGRPSATYVVHQKMNEKRYRKLDAVAERYPLFRRFGAAAPKVGVLCWGSTAGPVHEALKRMDEADVFGVFVPQLLAPLPAAQIQQFVDDCETVLVIEMSHQGQFHQYLRSQIDLPKSRTRLYCRSGGMAFTAEEILTELQKTLAAVTVAGQEVMS